MQFNLKQSAAIIALIAIALGVVVALGLFETNIEDRNSKIYYSLQRRISLNDEAMTLGEWTLGLEKHFDDGVRITFSGVDTDHVVGPFGLEDIKLKNSVRLVLRKCNATYRIRNGCLVIVPFDTEVSEYDYNGPPIRSVSRRRFLEKWKAAKNAR